MFTKSLFGIILILSASSASAQSDEQKILSEVLQRDSLLWEAYNHCDTSHLEDYFTDDAEFYHDKGGITFGNIAIANSVRKNICGNPNYHVRREAVPGKVVIYPMKNNNIIYGAIIAGEHYFYEKVNDQPENRSGLAQFANLWLLVNGKWKMARIFSYDHGAAVR